MRDCNFRALENINDDFEVLSVTAMKQDSILIGRPYGGTAILWRKSCLVNVNKYTMLDSSRCMGISFGTPIGMCFIFNVYLPCLSMYNDKREIELVECLSFIDATIDSQLSDTCCDSTIILLGDFNVSRDAIYTDNKLSSLNDLLNCLDLECCDDLDKSGVGHTYKHTGLNQFSYIDNEFISRQKKQLIQCVEVVDRGANLSNHNAVTLSVKICPAAVNSYVNSGVTSSQSVSWTEDNCPKFYELSEAKLMNLRKLLLPCMHNGNNGGFCSPEHRGLINGWCDELIEDFLSVVKELHVTQPYVNKKLGIFWTPELRALKQKSIDIHNAWKSLGRPRNGIINEERLRVKCQYKNAIDECRKKAELYKKQNFIY